MTRLRVSAVFHRSVDEVLRSAALRSFWGISDAEGCMHRNGHLEWLVKSELFFVCVYGRNVFSNGVR